MATLTVLKFDNADGAQQALDRVGELQRQELIKVIDAATVSWPEDCKKPRTRQAVDMPCLGAMDGSFWGMLFGMLFFMPFLGALFGAAMGALAGAFTDIGIDDDFIADVKSKVQKGTSALFLMSEGEVVDRVTESLNELNPELIATNLSNEQEATLNEAFQH